MKVKVKVKEKAVLPGNAGIEITRSVDATNRRIIGFTTAW